MAASIRDELGADLQRRRLQYKLRRWGERLLVAAEPVIVFGGLAVVIVLQIPWLSGTLEKLGLQDGAGLEQAVVVTVLAAVFLQMRAVAQGIERAPMEQRHFADPLDVYPLLRQRMKEIRKNEEKQLDVLGMTLYTAWPSIGFWLQKKDMQGWTIRLAAVTEQNEGVGQLVPEDWFDESRANLNRAARAGMTPALLEQKITIETYAYDFMPALHGFRLGNGDLFYSLLPWGVDGRIGREGYSYEFVPNSDTSASATAIREVFDSWFERAQRVPYVPP